MTVVTQKPNTDKRDVSFEDAITMTGYGKYNLFVLLAAGCCLMCVIIETMSMMFIIPAAQCDLNLGLSEKGLLSSISFFGVVSSSHFFGYKADTTGRKKVLIFSLVSSAILSFICSIVSWNWLFILLRFFNGALIGGSSAVIYAFAGEFHNDEYRPKIISWIGTFVAFGNMFLPGMAWLILPQQWSFEIAFLNIYFRPWRLLVIIYALPSLLSALCLYILPESPKYLQSQGKNQEVMDILTKMFCVNSGKSKDEYLVSSVLWDELGDSGKTKKYGLVQSIWKQTVPLFKKAFLLKTLMVCFLQFGIFFSTSGVVMWYPEILNSMAHYSEEISNNDVNMCKSVLYEMEEEVFSNATFTNAKVCKDVVDTEVFLVSLLVGLAYVLMFIIMGALINRLGKKKLLVVYIAVTTVAGVLAQLVYGYTYIQILVGFFLLGGASISIVNAMVVDIYPTQIRAMGLAISLMCGRFGAMAGTNIMGPLLYQMCDYLFYVFAIDHVLIIVVATLLPTQNPILTEAIIA